MGQTIGRAPLPRDCLRFLNRLFYREYLAYGTYFLSILLCFVFFETVPRSCIFELWHAFNDIAEGFGLTIDEFQEIIKHALKDNLGITDQILNASSEKAFRLFDDDQVFCFTFSVSFLCFSSLLRLKSM